MPYRRMADSEKLLLPVALTEEGELEAALIDVYV